jgi:hypothetical protein
LVAAQPGARFEQYAPLGEESALFLRFAETEMTEDDVLMFANSYGLLGGAVGGRVRAQVLTDPASGEMGDRPGLVLEQIRTMREAVRLWELTHRLDRKGLVGTIRWDGTDTVVYLRPPGFPPRVVDAGYGEDVIVIASRKKRPELLETFKPGDLVEPARFRLRGVVNQQVGLGEVALRLVQPEQGGPDKLDVLPRSLLGALWLQLALAIGGNKEYRRCRECGRPFELTPSLNRTSRLTCSAACRNRSYRSRQDRARLLHSEGRPVKEIARELDSDAKTVRGWLKKTKGD